MQNMPPLHADHELDQLAAQFAHWRQSRTHPSAGRIPQPLWEQAVALAATLPPARVAKQLRVRVGDLKKHMGHRPAASPAGTARPLSFVEVPPALPGPQTPATTQIEIHRADGTRLCLYGPAATLPLAAVVQAFLEGRACSN